jgi:hypothetical protein
MLARNLSPKSSFLRLQNYNWIGYINETVERSEFRSSVPQRLRSRHNVAIIFIIVRAQQPSATVAFRCAPSARYTCRYH